MGRRARFQHIVKPWKIIDGRRKSAIAFAEELGEAPTRRGRRTSISGAIDLSMELLEQVQRDGDAQGDRHLRRRRQQ